MAGNDQTDYDGYVHLIQQVDELVAGFENHPDEATRERSMALLTGIDMLHRTALNRLVEGLRDHGAGGALDRVTTDRIVGTLLAFYDLAELDIPDELPDPGPVANADQVAFVPREQLTLRRPGGDG